ncbi:hypothetical protein CDL15_Pgr017366 [Punica granatum]|uniref:Uncharacterized protein n=1 Tax=Punica granatum TaxID=22663 RepID=A0A218Y326_PUNGR|nr:hypothetical protein CDL15_Pgr017366 [Punica granatum]
MQDRSPGVLVASPKAIATGGPSRTSRTAGKGPMIFEDLPPDSFEPSSEDIEDSEDERDLSSQMTAGTIPTAQQGSRPVEIPGVTPAPMASLFTPEDVTKLFDGKANLDDHTRLKPDELLIWDFKKLLQPRDGYKQGISFLRALRL